ncbi:MAG: hypothetical protein JWL63_2268 [Rhodocyclales bacterium]|nr:hypothetical protein [Rhodocyclales bacterium]
MNSKQLTLLSGIAGVVVLAGCATGKLEAQWSDPQFAGQTFGGSKVLVACQAAEQTVMRICQDQLAAQLRTLGVTPVMADVTTMVAEKPGIDRSLAAARSLGAQSVMMLTLSPITTVTSSGSGVGFGIGSGGYHSGVGFGMSFPVGSGAQSTATTYSSDSTLTNVATGRLMWSGKVSTMSQEVPDQIASLAKLSVESARKAGML